MTKKKKDSSNSLEDFIINLLKDKGLAGEDKMVFEQLKSDLMGDLEERINAAILAAMPEERLASFEKILDTGSAAEIQKFCMENVPNLSEITALEMLNFRKTYLTAI
ncbi:MAG: DUF5663 domain-containing protein [Patescibacteria group bacterium]|nr:DUF5663 domain-containing protein [Patescibacteria group bacterium]